MYEAVREAAGNAVIGVCGRTDNAALGGEAVLVELKQASDPAVKNSWITILASLGYAKALPALLTAGRDADESVAVHTLEQLGRWPDPSPNLDELCSCVGDIMFEEQWERGRALSVLEAIDQAGTIPLSTAPVPPAPR